MDTFVKRLFQKSRLRQFFSCARSRCNSVDFFDFKNDGPFGFQGKSGLVAYFLDPLGRFFESFPRGFDGDRALQMVSFPSFPILEATLGLAVMLAIFIPYF